MTAPSEGHITVDGAPVQSAQVFLLEDVDPTALGERFELSGGHIRMAVLRAAFCAAAAEQPVSQEMLVEAALFECQALGKLIRS